MLNNRSVLWMLLILSSLVSSNTFGQSAPSIADSIQQRFDAVVREKRIGRITEYIRHSNLSHYDHQWIRPYLEEAYGWEARHSNIRLLNTIRLGHVNVALAEGDRVEATQQLQNILDSEEELPLEDSISTYTFLFGIYTSIGAYAKAWEVLEIRDRVLSHSKESTSFLDTFRRLKYSDLASLYLETGNYEAAMQQYRLLIDIATKANDLHLLAGGYNNLGLVYMETGDPDSAIAYFEQAASLWKLHLNELESPSPNDSGFGDLVMGNIGYAYNAKGMFQEAIPLLENDVREALRLKNNMSAINGLHELSQSYLGLHEPERALVLVDSAGRMMERGYYPTIEALHLERKIEALERNGKMEEALKLWRSLVTLKDSTATREKKTRVAVMEVVYEVEEKNRTLNEKNIQLTKTEATSERRRANQQLLLVGVIMMLVILGIVTISLINRRKAARKLAEQYHQIEHQKEIIAESLSAKETLLKEIHHRVKNNIQLISGLLELQAVKSGNENVREMIEETQSRVHSMALIHQQLYQSEDLGKIDFREYVTKLTHDIAVAFTDERKQIDIQLDLGNISLDINTAVPLGLVINELVVNSYKHGFKGREKGRIGINLVPLEGDNFELTVMDDGVGLPKDFKGFKADSLGLRLVRGLTRQLGGEYRFENGEGTRFIIRFSNDQMI